MKYNNNFVNLRFLYVLSIMASFASNSRNAERLNTIFNTKNNDADIKHEPLNIDFKLKIESLKLQERLKKPFGLKNFNKTKNSNNTLAKANSTYTIFYENLTNHNYSNHKIELHPSLNNSSNNKMNNLNHLAKYIHSSFNKTSDSNKKIIDEIGTIINTYIKNNKAHHDLLESFNDYGKNHHNNQTYIYNKKPHKDLEEKIHIIDHDINHYNNSIHQILNLIVDSNNKTVLNYHNTTNKFSNSKNKYNNDDISKNQTFIKYFNITEKEQKLNLHKNNQTIIKKEFDLKATIFNNSNFNQSKEISHLNNNENILQKKDKINQVNSFNSNNQIKLDENSHLYDNKNKYKNNPKSSNSSEVQKKNYSNQANEANVHELNYNNNYLNNLKVNLHLDKIHNLTKEKFNVTQNNYIENIKKEKPKTQEKFNTDNHFIKLNETYSKSYIEKHNITNLNTQLKHENNHILNRTQLKHAKTYIEKHNITNLNIQLKHENNHILNQTQTQLKIFSENQTKNKYESEHISKSENKMKTEKNKFEKSNFENYNEYNNRT